MIKFLTRIFKLLVWAIASLYFVAVVLTHIPVVQERLGAEVSALLAEELETYVSVRNVNLGFLNRVVIEDVEIKDKQKETLIKAKTIAVTPDFFDILKGKITLISAQLFGADVKLYKKTEDGELNCQFIVDKLSNPENKEPSKLDLRINTLIVRNSAVSYDLNYLPKKHSGVVDFNHIRLTGINSNLVLYQLKGDNIDLAIKRLAFKEANAFDLQNLTCDFTKSKAAIALKNVDLKLADGKLLSDSLVYDFEQKTVRGDIDAEYKDLAVSAYVSGSKEQILVERLQLHNAVNSLLVKGNGAVNQLPSGNVQWRADIADSNIDVQELKRTVFELTGSNINLPKALEEARFIAFSGKTDGVLEQGFKDNPLLKINGNIDGDIKSGFGDIALNLAKTPEKIVAKFNTDKLLLGKILADSRFNVLSADMETSVPVATLASLKQGFELEKLQDLAVKGEVKQFDYDGKTFKNIVANLTLSNNVLVGKLNVAPQNIASFDADIDLNMSALKEKKLTGKLKLENLSYEKYHLAQVVADFNGDEVNIKTDLADINLRGDIDKKNLDSDIHIYDMAQVDKFLNLGTVTKGAVDANLHLLGDSLFGDIMSEQLTVSSFDLRDVDVQFSKKGNRIESVVKTATGSQHSTFNSQESVLKVNLHSAVNLLQNDKGGISGANVHIMPSQIFVKDTLFRVSESDVVYDNNVLVINNLKVQHDDQHVIINGRADRNSNDSIEADISNIDVPYILNFVKFSAVSFTGKANGHAVVKKLFSKPEANAMLTVDNFTFEDGCMGKLYASATWNNED
ncbi:MAG: hypothetical protein HUK07_02520, partial [Bacteroidaceae bacterium]|nr:hypothetical protein [Bacteroidaceae bacterium]